MTNLSLKSAGYTINFQTQFLSTVNMEHLNRGGKLEYGGETYWLDENRRLNRDMSANSFIELLTNGERI
jgi:hypothetical protein